MDPKIWGRSGWKFLFSVALDYPVDPDFQQIHNYMRFFSYLQYVLPCEVCRINYADHLLQIPIEPYLTSRDNLFLWILKMHNLVNQQNGIPLLTRQGVMNKYFDGDLNKVIDCRQDPRIWGRDGWKFLFAIAYEYPKEPSMQEILHYKRFFTYLQYVLPCSTYRIQYATQLDILPIDAYLTTRIYLFKWVLEMHNLVNKEIGRPLLSHSDVIRHYFKNQIIIDQPCRPLQMSEPPNARGEALTEGFEADQLGNSTTAGAAAPMAQSVDPSLFNKNLSLGILLLLAGFGISQAK